MRNLRRVACPIVGMALVAALVGCTGEDPVNAQGVLGKVVAPAPQVLTVFPIGTASSFHVGQDVSTVLRAPGGSTVLARLYWSASNATLAWSVPNLGSETWDNTSGNMPALVASNHAIALIYDRVQAGLGKRALDEPGCDWVPDFLETPGMLECCEWHDECFANNGCNWTSWIPDGQLSMCDLCNAGVVLCFMANWAS